jgi:hypothetical protein
VNAALRRLGRIERIRAIARQTSAAEAAAAESARAQLTALAGRTRALAAEYACADSVGDGAALALAIRFGAGLQSLCGVTEHDAARAEAIADEKLVALADAERRRAWSENGSGVKGGGLTTRHKLPPSPLEDKATNLARALNECRHVSRPLRRRVRLFDSPGQRAEARDRCNRRTRRQTTIGGLRVAGRRSRAGKRARRRQDISATRRDVAATGHTPEQARNERPDRANRRPPNICNSRHRFARNVSARRDCGDAL